MDFKINSETGKLRKVMMYRPENEMELVTKETLEYYQFRAIPNLHKMQTEFDDFVKILKENFVEVVLLNEHLKEAATPNMLYIRDYIGVSEKGLIVMNMKNESRKREPSIAKSALRKIIPVHIEIKEPNILEGGDLVYIDEKTLAIGFGPRSNIAGIRKLIKKMKRTSIKEFVLVPLPNFRVHLDGSFMCIDQGTYVIHEPSLTHKPAQIIGKNSKMELFLDYLRMKGFRTISATDEETKTFGPNLLTLANGKVISYEWNTELISRLERRGYDVITIKGKELVKGGGGPHCMTTPILRDTI